MKKWSMVAGMVKLKIICLVLFSLSLLSGVTGAISLHQQGSNYTIASDHSLAIRVLGTLINALILAGAFVGIQTRTRHMWRFGWILFAILLLEVAILGIFSALKLASPERWIVSLAWLAVCSLISVYWARWWKQQGDYFEKA